jgi:hypothetical protein
MGTPYRFWRSLLRWHSILALSGVMTMVLGGMPTKWRSWEHSAYTISNCPYLSSEIVLINE